MEAALLFRALQARLLARFSLFYGYIAFVLFSTLIEYVTFNYFYNSYFPVYWSLEFASALIGCAIIFELYRQSLRPFPLLAALANKVMLFTVALLIARVLVGNTWHGTLDPQAMAIILERDLRITQVVFLSGLLLLVYYYSVALGRNIKGLALGYILFLGLVIVELTLRSTLGVDFNEAFMYIQPATYDAILAIWLFALWIEDPVVLFTPARQLDEDYVKLVNATRKRLAQTEEQLLRLLRQ